jgi:hypothetical protein
MGTHRSWSYVWASNATWRSHYLPRRKHFSTPYRYHRAASRIALVPDELPGINRETLAGSVRNVRRTASTSRRRRPPDTRARLRRRPPRRRGRHRPRQMFHHRLRPTARPCRWARLCPACPRAVPLRRWVARSATTAAGTSTAPCLRATSSSTSRRSREPFGPAATLLLELHVEGKIDLPLGLTGPLIGDRVLRLDEEVVHGLSFGDDLPDSESERDAVVVVLEVIDPDRGRAQVEALAKGCRAATLTSSASPSPAKLPCQVSR